MIVYVIVGSCAPSTDLPGERMTIDAAAVHEWRMYEPIVVVDLDSLTVDELLATRDALDCFGGVVIASGSAQTSVARLWLAIVWPEVVQSAAIADRVRRAFRCRPVPRAPVRDWIANEFGELSPRGRKLIRVLPRLDDLRVKAWARTLDCSSRHLRRLALSELGYAPKCVIRCYVCRSAERLRMMGISLKAMAPLLGYASESSLCTALARPCSVPWCDVR